MSEKQQPSTESWDGFVDNWLKAEHFKGFPGAVFVAQVNSSTNKEGKGIIVLDVQYDGRKFKKQLNITDIRTLQKLGIKKPSELAQCNIEFEKVKVFDPSKQKQVDSISVSGIKR